MTFPDIRACLVCQHVRVEYGKLSVRGLFGLLPDVGIHILAQRWGTPISLMFLISSGPGSGTYSARPVIFAPDGDELIAGFPLTLHFDESRSSNSFAADFAGVGFPDEGLYTFALFVEEQKVFKDTFSVAADGLPAHGRSPSEWENARDMTRA
jgi:hypothetical protein